MLCHGWPVYAPYLTEYNRGVNVRLLAVLEMAAGGWLMCSVSELGASCFGATIAIFHTTVRTPAANCFPATLPISSEIVTF